MSLIREVKERADIVKVAELYGMKLNRAYKCVCPFHKEKTASLSISPQKQIWKCFGCGKGGDVISLVSELLNINALEAAKSINYTLGLGLDPNQKSSYFQINKYKNRQKTEEMFKKCKALIPGSYEASLNLIVSSHVGPNTTGIAVEWEP